LRLAARHAPARLADQAEPGQPDRPHVPESPVLDKDS
jgi:hypothetical protein